MKLSKSSTPLSSSSSSLLTMEMEGEMKTLSRVCLVVIVSLCYCNLVSGRLAKGKWRLISLLPIFYIFTIIPLYLSSAFFTVFIAVLITWLSNFKLLLFAFDQGPLSSKSLPIFIAMAALPFKLKAITPRKPKKLPLNLATEIPILAVLISVVCDYKEYIHPYLLNALYFCFMFLVVEIVIGLSNLLVRALLGVEVEPPSDEPYLSTSLQEFWGTRWNLTVTNLMRETVHKPILSVATAVLGKDWARPTSLLASFIVSGLMHELVFWYGTRGTPSWEMTMFFVVNGVCVVLEFGLKKKMKKKWGIALPWYVSWPVTFGFFLVTGNWLFFPPLTRNGFVLSAIQELRFAGELVKDTTMEVWLHLFA